jgi:hypothetical protein
MLRAHRIPHSLESVVSVLLLFIFRDLEVKISLDVDTKKGMCYVAFGQCRFHSSANAKQRLLAK